VNDPNAQPHLRASLLRTHKLPHQTTLATTALAAVQAVSFSEPRTTAISSKAPVVDLDIAERGKITPRYGPKITTYRLLFAMAAGGDWEKTGKEACCNSSPRLKARYRPSLHT
jgi:hypothetical protein